VKKAFLRFRWICWLLLCGFVLTPSRTGSAAVLAGDTVWMHDPSRVVACGGKYFIYYSGDNLPMRYSEDFINWKRGKDVLPKLPSWIREAVPKNTGKFVWAPDVIYLNQRYYLFYSFSTFGSKVSATGLLTSPTLDPESKEYQWTDRGLVLASNDSSDFNAIDPAPILDAGGNLWLAIGSWNSGGIKLVRLDNSTGKPVTEPVTLAAGQATGPEAPYIHYHDGYYYLFENEGNCCQGMNSTYRIMVGRSTNISGPYLDKDGRDLARGGGTLFLGTDGIEIGPGHVGVFQAGGIDRFTFHYYDSRTNGIPTLGMKTLVWGTDGWPMAGSELPAGRYAIESRVSGLALGIYNNNFADGTPIDQFTYLGGPTQHWNVAPVGDGYYSIGSIGTGKYLDLFGCNPKDGTKISQYPWYGNECQKWRIEQTSDGSYRVLSKGGGTVLTLLDGSLKPQAPVQGFAWTGDLSQKWVFRRLP
jgi:arabinan endo-1,5-alpha-L-arabinosidase